MKKPLDLGFLNFTTLRRRHHYLNQELSLNRRLCPTIYLAVLPVTASGSGVKVGGQGRPLDYVLKMVRLPQERMMDEVADRGSLPRSIWTGWWRCWRLFIKGRHRPAHQPLWGARGHHLQP
jgi:uncharacterized protein